MSEPESAELLRVNCECAAHCGEDVLVTAAEYAAAHREDVRRLASKVRTEGDPGSLATARVRISGAGRSAVVEVDAPRGSPAHPLSEQEQRAKFHGLVGGMLDASLIDVTYAILKELHRCQDVRALISQFPAVDVGTVDAAKAGYPTPAV